VLRSTSRAPVGAPVIDPAPHNFAADWHKQEHIIITTETFCGAERNLLRSMDLSESSLRLVGQAAAAQEE
jgi:hypothetical protein